ncbi:histone-lysine N-methyltransferase SETDB1-A [Mastacembelus armatus]|uniref:histone-lysine N-methyltransferase SETDB1-A n=1 Tax=Mastacembelus armatus TaxID=205130 RepID=UPI000E4617AB|nr:histone-lysine N-methyltransferase SETDB1-B-like [Mastacembelus armatus]XP_026155228.1 histone-lysine N-methyltransferase SETDB1-B-like [Mastacembelus armatus]
MDGDEIEMSREELQRWIREKVQNSELISSDVLQKCKQLQALLERREQMASRIMKLCESVAACEAVVKRLYVLLGWEYKDTDSDDDHSVTGCGYRPISPCDSVHSETQVRCSPAMNVLMLQDSDNLMRDYAKKHSDIFMRKPVVMLTRLPEYKISALRQPSAENHSSEDEFLGNSDSDMQWEPDGSSDSDFSISEFKTNSKKRRRIDQDTKNPANSHATSQASIDTGGKSNATETSTPQAGTNANIIATTSAPQVSTYAKSSTATTSTPPGSTYANSNTATTSTPPGSTYAKSSTATTSTPQANSNTNAKNATKTSTPAGSTNGVTSVVAALRESSGANKTSSAAPSGKIIVNMNVLARRRAMEWKPGKIVEILTREDGRIKYKVTLEEKGRILVSGHHIAFDCIPKIDELFIGARVVVKLQGEQTEFCPGIMAELPTRKNRMRFLVFTDDHRPVYIGLPLLHLVCKPLEDPLDDIEDESHKNFIKQYLRTWPYPPQSQYRVGQIINAESDGAQQKCEVLVVDSSLIQVVFQKDQHKEWIYRGSMRLQHMINMMENLESKKDNKKKKKNL